MRNEICSWDGGVEPVSEVFSHQKPNVSELMFPPTQTCVLRPGLRRLLLENPQLTPRSDFLAHRNIEEPATTSPDGNHQTKMEIAQLRTVVNALAARLGVDPSNPLSSYRPMIQQPPLIPIQYFAQPPMMSSYIVQPRSAPVPTFFPGGGVAYNVAPSVDSSSQSMTSSPTFSVLSTADTQHTEAHPKDIQVTLSPRTRPTISTAPSTLSGSNESVSISMADLNYSETPTAALPDLTFGDIPTWFDSGAASKSTWTTSPVSGGPADFLAGWSTSGEGGFEMES